MCFIDRRDFHREINLTCDKRTPRNHSLQLIEINNEPAKAKLYGFRKDSVLNSSKFFHCANNLVFDVMHDIFEGVASTELFLVIKTLVQKKKFSVKYLNNKINAFNYGPDETKNRPVPNFTIEMLSRPGNSSIKQKAIQCWLLLRSFPFLVIEKLDDSDKDYIILIILLQQIVEIVMSLEITDYMILELEMYVSQHNSLFKNLFPTINPINKHHHLTHYGDCIREMGPLIQYSCMKFEAKHFNIKQQIMTGRNFINVPKSIGNRQALIQSFDIYNLFFTSPMIDIISAKEVLLKNMNCVQSISLLHPTEDFSTILQIKEILLNNISYRPNHVMVQPDSESIIPNFIQIIEIIKYMGEIYIYGEFCDIIEHSNHLNSYKIKTKSNKFTINNVKEIKEWFKPLTIWTIRFEKYVVSKQYIY